MKEVLRRFASGKISLEEACEVLKTELRLELRSELRSELKSELKLEGVRRVKDFARIDADRLQRTGVPEIIFAEGKSSDEVAEIAVALATAKGFALVSRASGEDAAAVKAAVKVRVKKNKNKSRDAEVEFEVDYNGAAGTVVVKRRGHEFEKAGKIGLIAAGTADIPVAEEVRVVAEVCGCEVVKAYDVGIAGLHRLVEPLEKILRAGVAAVVVVAGMEGALPSVVASLVDVPVVGVPTSVGYGLGGEGVAAILSMLQSCSPGLAVVNIDNGVGAGTFAAKCARYFLR